MNTDMISSPSQSSGHQKSDSAAWNLLPETASRTRVTTREKDVIYLIAEGLTTDEIARALFISVETIKSHKKNIFHKLGTRNCAMTVMRAIQYELIPIAPLMQPMV